MATMLEQSSLSVLSAQHQQLSRFKRLARLTIAVNNMSQSRARFRLEGSDRDSVCRFEFVVPGGGGILAHQAEVWLAPAETVQIPVRVTLPTPALIGLGRTVYHLTTTVTDLSGSFSSRSILHRVARSPLIDPWLCSLAGVIGLVLLLFAGQNGLLFAPAPHLAGTSEPSVTTADRLADLAAAIQAVPLPRPALPPPVAPELTVGQRYEAIFQEIAPQYGLEWQLLAEVAYQESRMNPWALGRDYDMGLMQIIPTTWNEWAPKVGVTDPYDPYSNVLVGAAYLAYVRDFARAHGRHEVQWMLVGYNWGPHNLDQLFEKKGEWAEIPEKQRNYAIQILQARAAGLKRWQSDKAAR
jgi:hypothetical protein